MTKKTDTLPAIEELVKEIARRAATTDDYLSFAEKVDALKVLTPYYLALRKEPVESTDGGETLAKLSQAFKEPTDGALRSGRGRNNRTEPFS